MTWQVCPYLRLEYQPGWDFERRSFSAQIADLALNVLVPLGRLYKPTARVSSPTLTLRGSRVREPCADILRDFEPSRDSAYLQSITGILDSPQVSLYSLTRCFEALGVSDYSLTARHWRLPEDGMTLSVWSMLSYYGHCREQATEIRSDLLEIIEQNLIDALRKDRPIFETICQYELLKEKQEALAIASVALKIRAFCTKRAQSLMSERQSQLYFGFEATLNYSECQAFDEVCRREQLPASEKIASGERIWKELSLQNPRIAQEVLGAAELAEMEDQIRSFTIEMDAAKNSIDRGTKRAALTTVKRALQALHEYEHLDIAHKALVELRDDRSKPDRDVLIQIVVVLRESFKSCVSDATFPISKSKSIATVTPLINQLRDYFEHPEKQSLDTSGTTEEELYGNLFSELPDLLERAKQLMGERLRKLQRLLQPHPQISADSAATALASRSSHSDDYSHFRALLAENYPKIADFVSRIRGSKPFSPPVSKSSASLLESLGNLREDLRPFNRTDLIHSLRTDTVLRLRFQRKLAHCLRQFEDLLRGLRRLELGPGQVIMPLLEDLYSSVKEVRNFQTHHLWIHDTKGLANALLRLAFETAEILNSALQGKQGRRLPEGSIVKQIFHDAAFGRLTCKGLTTAIGKGLDINEIDCKSRSLLHFVAGNPSPKSLAVARLLIKQGANIHQADCTLNRPLHNAAESGFADLAQLLIRCGAVPDARSQNGTPMEIAQFHEHHKLAQLLGKTEGVTRSSRARALLDAVKSLDIDSVWQLVQAGVDVTCDFEGFLPLVALFRLETVPMNRQLDVANVLIKAGACLDQQEPMTGESCLHTAVTYSRSREVIEFLMERGPNVDTIRKDGRSPLHCAMYSSFEWVQALVQAGANPNLRDAYGDTPLLLLCNQHHPDRRAVECLVAHGANVEDENRYGTVLHHAAERADPASVSLLLKHGASPYRLGRDGLYAGGMPHRITSNRTIQYLLVQRMSMLFLHLSPRDQVQLLNENAQLGHILIEDPLSEPEDPGGSVTHLLSCDYMTLTDSGHLQSRFVVPNQIVSMQEFGCVERPWTEGDFSDNNDEDLPSARLALQTEISTGHRLLRRNTSEKELNFVEVVLETLLTETPIQRRPSGMSKRDAALKVAMGGFEGAKSSSATYAVQIKFIDRLSPLVDNNQRRLFLNQLYDIEQRALEDKAWSEAEWGNCLTNSDEATEIRLNRWLDLIRISLNVPDDYSNAPNSVDLIE